MKRLLGKLLHMANSSPPWGQSKVMFYAMKERILARYGTPDGYDVQHIPGKICFGCDGTGQFEHMSGDQDYCYRCGGNGWYKSPVWVALARHRLGNYVFHTPKERWYQEPKPNATNIEGYVQHKFYRGLQPEVAMLWLALIFDRKLWWREINEHHYCRWQWKPMLFLTCVSSRIRRAWHWWHSRCRECERHSWGEMRCLRCQMEIEKGLPF